MKTLSEKQRLIILVIAAFLVRIICAVFYYGHPTDMACFNGWADLMMRNGPQGFYTSESFTDYPPLYMYVLWVIGFIKNILPLGEGAVGVLLKLPAISCDILIALLLYKIAPKHKNAAAAFALFNPVLILNSSLWGQVDAVFTLFVLLSLVLAMQKRYLSAYLLFAVSLIVKPQSLFYAPIFLLAAQEEVFSQKFDRKRLLYHLGAGGAAIAFALLLCVPFGLKNVAEQYVKTLSSYNYLSVNACNFWTALGLNWAVAKPFHSIFSAVAIIGAVGLSVLFYKRIKGEHKLFLVSGFVCLFVFTFAAKMHERYAFPAILLLFVAYILTEDKRIFRCCIALNVLQLINIGYVLFFGQNAENTNNFLTVACGILTVALAVYLTMLCIRLCDLPERADNFEDFSIKRTDIAIMLAVMAVYSVIAFTGLGDRVAPTSGVLLENGYKGYEIGENDGISGFRIFLGSPHLNKDNTLVIGFLKDNTLVQETEIASGSVFVWKEYEAEIESADSIIIGTDGKVNVLELAFLDKSGNIIDGAGELFDEKELVPDRATHLNGTYFDEIYHARTAYEFIEGEDVYEWTHPPLGKILISIGIRLFGMNPFGWRFVGTLIGVLMIPVLYILAKKLLGDTFIATFATILLTFDFMHLVQTRIATIDVYVVFFIMLQYLFMLLWLQSKEYGKGLLWLGLSGVSFGLSAASKWTGIYAGAGLAVIFFSKLMADKNSKRVQKHIRFALIAFVAVPIVIYLLSYIPFLRCEGGGFARIWENQVDMLNYHSRIDEAHAYSSRWYEWAAMIRPVWYYSGTAGEGISAFGNPLVWWMGIPTLLYTLYKAFKRDKTAIFLSIGYWAQLLPWVAVTRITFMYHYFPCVPFSILMTAYTFKKILPKKAMAVYAVLVIVMFVAFLPVLTGRYINPEIVENFLRWSDEWVLIRDR